MVCRDLTEIPHTRLHNILQQPTVPASVSQWRVTQGDECLQLKSEKSLQSSVANMTELHCTSRSGLPQQINLSTKNPLYLHDVELCKHTSSKVFVPLLHIHNGVLKERSQVQIPAQHRLKVFCHRLK